MIEESDCVGTGVAVGAGVLVGRGVFVGGMGVNVGDAVGKGVGVGGLAIAPQPTSNAASTTSQNKRVNLDFCIFPPQVEIWFLDGASH
jgi:hypothetical protein